MLTHLNPKVQIKTPPPPHPQLNFKSTHLTQDYIIQSPLPPPHPHILMELSLLIHVKSESELSKVEYFYWL